MIKNGGILDTNERGVTVLHLGGGLGIEMAGQGRAQVLSGCLRWCPGLAGRCAWADRYYFEPRTSVIGHVATEGGRLYWKYMVLDHMLTAEANSTDGIRSCNTQYKSFSKITDDLSACLCDV
jgi:hypothetical protein